MKYRDFLMLARLRSGVDGVRLVGDVQRAPDGTLRLGLVVREIDPQKWLEEATLVESKRWADDALPIGRDEAPRAKQEENVTWIFSKRQPDLKP